MTPPDVAGYLRDSQGSYGLALVIFATVAAAMLVAMLCATQPTPAAQA